VAKSNTYIIAEVNTSHFGEMDQAKKLISAAIEAGANCVKFQSWSENSLYSEDYYEDNPIARRFTSKFSLDETQLLELSQFARKSGIDFASTPYSKQEVDFLVEECQVPFIKIASMDLNNHSFLKYIASTAKPIILSTGMGSLDEILEAVNLIESLNPGKLTVLHCISLYPAPDEYLNLRNITMFTDTFAGIRIGFSDHSKGKLASIAAVALGAEVIEKHVTLNSDKIGMDNQMAMEFLDFSQMVREIRLLETMLGTRQRILTDEEFGKRALMRRSLTLLRSKREGETLAIEDLDMKRPGTGIQVTEIDKILGRKVNRDIEPNRLLKWSDLI
jgi:N-acetylneuraminate synthase